MNYAIYINTFCILRFFCYTIFRIVIFIYIIICLYIFSIVVNFTNRVSAAAAPQPVWPAARRAGPAKAPLTELTMAPLLVFSWYSAAALLILCWYYVGALVE